MFACTIAFSRVGREKPLTGLAFGLSEFGLSMLRRSKGSAANKDDQGSLRLIWGVILVGTCGARGG